MTTQFRSPKHRVTAGYWLAMLCCTGLLAFSHRAAAQTEVRPEMSLYLIMHVSKPSEQAGDFSCGMKIISGSGDSAVVQDADGNFQCGDQVSGRIVGVLDTVGSLHLQVAGHRIRFTRRVSSTVTETYTGAIDWDFGGQFVAGEYTVLENTPNCRPCVGQLCRPICVPVLRQSGPIPFIADLYPIGG